MASITWTDQELVPGAGGSSDSPALAAFNGRLFMTWKGAGDDQRLFIHSTGDGQQWTDQELVPGAGGSSDSPALAAFNGRLFMTWKGAGDDQRLFIHSTGPAITLSAIEDGGRFIEVAGSGFTPSQTVTVDYDITTTDVPTTDQTGQDTLTSDDAGRFIDRIRVNLGGDIHGAAVKATDVASAKVATASIGE